jgi:dTMP kinase
MQDINIVTPNHPYPAKFITLEGIDGSGKSAQINYLKYWGMKNDLYFELTAEPTRFIREMVLGVGYDDITRSLMFLADRTQHNETIIRPALKGGRHIISDRYFDSTYAYNLFKSDMSSILNYDLIRINDHISIKPDLTILLDVPINIGKKRVVKRKTDVTNNTDLFDMMGFEFFERVREGYLRLAQLNPDRIKIINADKDAESVFDEVLVLVKPLLMPQLSVV